VHLTSAPAIWYAARASGVAAYVVLTITISIGISMGGKAQSSRWPRFATEDVHRFGGLLVGSLIGVHVLSIAVDSFLPFSIGQLVIPFTATYRVLWTGLGIFAAELLLALAITNHYRKRMPHRFWRSAHYLNFVVWTAASLHAVFSGTDRSAWWLALIFAVSIGTVLALLVWRFGRYAFGSRPVALAGFGTVAVVPLLLLAGPFKKTPHAWNAEHFSGSLSGEVISSGTNTKQIVSFVGSSQSPQKLFVRADLLVSPRSLDATSLQLEYLPSGSVCRGRVTKIGLESFSGRCTLRSGRERWIDASWAPAENGTGVIGTIRMHA
jgi:methionine sulfoxide reductase heme-binding subunit